jgi:hypothetical protein
MENDLLSFEKEINDFITFMEDSGEPQEKSSKTEPPPPDHPPYFIELVKGIQNSLRLMRNYTKISQTNESGNGLSQYFSPISDEIENLEAVINCFLKFNTLSTPIKKRNTIHNLIEEVLKKHENKLVEREILIFRRFENDLPETIIPDELLKYILNSVLQYAIASTAHGGGIGFSTRYLTTDGGKENGQPLPGTQRKYIEILVIFTNHQRTMEESGKSSKMHKGQENNEALELILRLAKQVVQKNHGAMEVSVDGKKGRNSVLLTFPAERREVVYYPPGK